MRHWYFVQRPSPPSPKNDFKIGLEKTTEIIEDVPSLFSALKRVRIETLGKVSDSDFNQTIQESRPSPLHRQPP